MPYVCDGKGRGTPQHRCVMTTIYTITHLESICHAILRNAIFSSRAARRSFKTFSFFCFCIRASFCVGVTADLGVMRFRLLWSFLLCIFSRRGQLSWSESNVGIAGRARLSLAQIVNIFSGLEFDFIFIRTLSVYLRQAHNLLEFDKTRRGLQVAYYAYNTLTDCH